MRVKVTCLSVPPFFVTFTFYVWSKVVMIETFLVTFETKKTLFRYFHLFSTLEYFNTGFSRRMGPYLEALVCAATFPFTFCSAAWFSVEVVRSTIFEEMEGEVEGIVSPAAWLCNLQKDTRSQSSMKVVSKLSKRPPNVVSKLSQRCLKVVPSWGHSPSYCMTL